MIDEKPAKTIKHLTHYYFVYQNYRGFSSTKISTNQVCETYYTIYQRQRVKMEDRLLSKWIK